jgi:putative addiction module CopG family antidote
MRVTLRPDLETFVRSEVASGRFKSVSAVVEAALNSIRSQNGVHHKPNDKIQRQIEAGLRDLREGRYTVYDEIGLKEFAEQVKRRGRARLKKLKAKAARA